MTSHTYHARAWLFAGLVAAASLVPAGCTSPSSNGFVPARPTDNQSRAMPANQTRAPRDIGGLDDGGSGGPS